MIYVLEDTSKVTGLFDGWEETLIYSCLQKVMGTIYVTDLEQPESALATVGCFAFYAGTPEKELVQNKPAGFVVMVPQNDKWSALIEEYYPHARRITRYAIKKDTTFDVDYLTRIVSQLPEGYELKTIDSHLYDQCLKDPVTYDFVSSFDNKNHYLTLGRGIVLMKDGKILSGASSFARYKKGIEIEVDTKPEARRQGFATIVCAALILNCLEEGLYPSWDAQNMDSVHLAEKLGYEFSHEYTAYEINDK